MRLFLAIVFLFIPASGQQLAPGEILARINNRYAQMNDVSASFSHSVQLRFKKNARQQAGSIKIKKGNKYRLETEQQTIVTDGVTVWMYTPATKQVLVDRFRANRQPYSPDKFLRGLPKDFIPISADTAGNLVMLSIRPSDKNTSMANIVSMNVWASDDNWTVEKIEVKEKNGTITTIQLTNLLFNTGLGEENFHFEITGDMHVVDMKNIQ
ncbi:MAG: outer membrane lipoprotein carrier protein LolA [Bacteroidota bacterium]